MPRIAMLALALGASILPPHGIRCEFDQDGVSTEVVDPDTAAACLEVGFQIEPGTEELLPEPGSLFDITAQPKTEISDAEERFAQLQAAIATADRAVEEKSAKIRDLEARLFDTEQSLATAQAFGQGKADEVKSLSVEVVNITEQLTRLTDQLAQKDQAIAELTAKLSETTASPDAAPSLPDAPAPDVSPSDSPAIDTPSRAKAKAKGDGATEVTDTATTEAA